MHSVNSFARISALAFGIAGVLAFGQAHGAAFQLKENSAKGLGRAFAGSGSAPGDASVIATNPAAMRHLEGTQFQGDVSLISFSAKFDGGGRLVGPTGPGTGFPISGGNGGDAGTIAAVPAMYFHTPLGEKAHLGASLTVPFGFKTEYDRDWVGRYHGVKTDLKTADLGLSLSYDVNPYVSFGAQVFVERLEVDLSNAVDLGTVMFSQGGGPLGFAPGNADVYSQLEGSSNDWGYTVGTLLSFNENTHMGLSYRSKVKHEIDNGKATFTATNAQATGGLAVLAARGLFVNTGGKAEIELPASATLSFTRKVNDNLSIMFDYSRTFWKPSFDSVTVDFSSNQPNNVLPFNYRDTSFTSLGADYKLSDTLTLRGGVAYDQTPTTAEHRDVRVPDTSRKWLSVGLSWAPSEKAEYSFGYTHLFTTDPTIDQVSATGSTLSGSYDVTGDVLGASINYKF
ncbi:outer membrane protein transport protein [Pseudoxanthomonas indica]|uniref:Long-chain fatty acid transport protein n=1 Tax=Pseudoxanthomonas indica TaxID=428993 RepID=A0A1T5KUG0_9GAMM|nr:outer membrane protein transport protein [Pseudoxanthomonas indica]GGD51695.1 membrane protein [Pseudoxanthomonas indica]SKC67280.1 long-chain fatty acid transport protein [Pseudoxanthomonas indica]